MKTVYELTREQLAELKQDYLIQMAEETGAEVYASEMANADAIVPDATIFEAYEGTVFTDDDFLCTAGN